jgi:hypothetical protein
MNYRSFAVGLLKNLYPEETTAKYCGIASAAAQSKLWASREPEPQCGLSPENISLVVDTIPR